MANKKLIGLVCIILLVMALSSTLCISTSTDEKKPEKNVPPTVHIDADVISGLAPLSVNFKAEADDLDGSVEYYDWDFGDGETSSKEKTFHTYHAPGSYKVILIVTDNDGAEANDSIVIEVNEYIEPNERPSAEASVDPDTAYVNEELKFIGTGEDIDGWIAKFEWDFDGDTVYDWYSNTTGQTLYSYATAGQYTAVFRVTDDDNDMATDSVSVKIQPRENTAPVALISQPDNNAQFESGQDIQFDGSVSYDPDEDNLTYAWDFGDSSVAYEAKPTHSYSEDGNYTVQLTVSDGQDTGNDSIILRILTVENHPPVAEIVTPEQDEVFEINTPVFFDGTNSSDPDDNFLYYYWDFGDGSPQGTGSTTTHVYTTVGTYTVVLRVDDGELSDTDSVRILITDQGSLNQPPEAVINEPENGDNFTIDEVITFSGVNSSDPDGDELNYTWDFKDDTYGYGEITTHSYSENGTYNVTLTVFDDQYSDTASVVIIVGPGGLVNTPPSAVISEPTMLESFETNETVICLGNQSSDPENDPLIYDWDFDDGSEHSYTENTQHRYTSEGIYVIRLTVSDGAYNDTDAVIISVVEGGINNSAPTAEIVEPTTGQSFAVNEVITFDGSNSSDPDNDPLTYSWNFGDGSTGSGVTTTHSYTIAGLYTVTLQVSDGSLNDTDRVTILIRVQFRSTSRSQSVEPNSEAIQTDAYIRTESIGSMKPPLRSCSYILHERKYSGSQFFIGSYETDNCKQNRYGSIY